MDFRGAVLAMDDHHDPRETAICGGEYFGDCTVFGVLIRRVVVGAGAAFGAGVDVAGFRATAGACCSEPCGGADFVTRGVGVIGDAVVVGGAGAIGGGDSNGVAMTTGASTSCAGVAPSPAAGCTASSADGVATGLSVSAYARAEAAATPAIPMPVNAHDAAAARRNPERGESMALMFTPDFLNLRRIARCPYRAEAAGRVSVKAAPWPGAEVTATSPPWARAISRTSAKPIP